MKKTLAILIYVFVSLEVLGKPTNIIKFSCEYEPGLIKQEQKDIGFLNNELLNTQKICSVLSCQDVIEVNINKTQLDGDNEYRLRNSWFDHQGILIDDFVLTKNFVTINTFVSQAYFLESYLINRVTGKTKRTFYRFDDPEFFYKLKKIEDNKDKKIPLYNEKGKLSLKTFKLFSLQPSEIFYFQGKCSEGLGV